MRERTIYFLFSDTGTCLARAINYCTKQSLNHVSISFDHELKEVYSFGRKRPKNPFIGGFVREDIRSDFLKDSNCAVYAYRLPVRDCEKVFRKIQKIEAQKHDYKYNFLGLIGVLLRVELERDNAFFCSQFIAMLLQETESFEMEKPLCFITPADIRNLVGLQEIYQGRLGDYQQSIKTAERKLVKGEQSLPKQSFIYLLSEKVKQFVIR